MTRKFFLPLFLVPLLVACGDDDGPGYGEYSRADLRYYAYAPPLIPHEILNRDCLDCHADGLVVQGYEAPVTPHPELVVCQQCHIRADEDIGVFRRNTFAGSTEPQALPLPQPAGPPLTPHRLFMREDCLVCHADESRTEVTQTTHPERLNCTQCHIPQETDVALFSENSKTSGSSQ